MKSITAIVERGKGRGKQLGYPTANMTLPESHDHGIYVAKAIYDGDAYKAAAFIGAAKTYDESDVKLEVYILDFDKDIYGQSLRVELLTKIRENKRFDTIDELINQISSDVDAVTAYFEKTPSI